ncbi:MAG: membrane protein insertase YidC [Granulosicoccus sp.]
METQRLLLYLAFGFLSLIIYQTWMMDYHAPAPIAQTGTATPGSAAGTATTLADAPSAADLPNATVGSVSPSAPAQIQGDANASNVSVTTDVIDVRISTQGATVTGVQLLDYSVSIEQPDTPFLMMSDDPLHYLVAESGLQSRANVAAPTHRELMTTNSDSYFMADGQDTLAIPFEWTSDSGVKVTKTLTFTRGSYVVTVDYLIENGSGEEWTANQYRQLKRKPGTKDEKQQFLNTYIGGVVSNQEDRYTKVSFGDMEDEDLNVSATDGWVAMIQHYFAAAWVPTDGEQNTAYSRYLPAENRYLIGMVSSAQSIPPAGQGSFSSTMYVGPKIQDNLSAVAEHLELTVDFGWLTIIAQPLFWILKTIHGFVGNWGWAIIFTTFIIKAVFYKLSEASYRSMAKMKMLQPKLASLKERYGDDRAKMGQATMEMYKKEKVNPLGGCLPMIVQIPVFIALYWTLLESVELRQAPFMLWIKDLSIRDPFFILPVIMAATMYFQQKLNPAPVDPIQAKVFQFLPLIFGVFFAFFPAGLVLYWVVNNSLSIAQQYYITRHVLADKSNKN